MGEVWWLNKTSLGPTARCMGKLRKEEQQNCDKKHMVWRPESQSVSRPQDADSRLNIFTHDATPKELNSSPRPYQRNNFRSLL